MEAALYLHYIRLGFLCGSFHCCWLLRLQLIPLSCRKVAYLATRALDVKSGQPSAGLYFIAGFGASVA